MSRKCDISGKAVLSGQNVSHAQNKTKRKFRPNLKKVKVLVNGKAKKLTVSMKTLKNIKKGKVKGVQMATTYGAQPTEEKQKKAEVKAQKPTK
jgi:large subunit ribosomal protein L28